MSCVTDPVSRVKCPFFYILLFGLQSDKAGRCRVCYQRGLLGQGITNKHFILPNIEPFSTLKSTFKNKLEQGYNLENLHFR